MSWVEIANSSLSTQSGALDLTIHLLEEKISGSYCDKQYGLLTRGKN